MDCHLSVDKNNSILIHINIQSINSYLDEFKLFIKKIDVDFHIIVLTETHLSDESDWIDLPGWYAFQSSRKTKGAVLLYWSTQDFFI